MSKTIPSNKPTVLIIDTAEGKAKIKKHQYTFGCKQKLSENVRKYIDLEFEIKTCENCRKGKLCQWFFQ
jgi:hypothetical protein